MRTTNLLHMHPTDGSAQTSPSLATPMSGCAAPPREHPVLRREMAVRTRGATITVELLSHAWASGARTCSARRDAPARGAARQHSPMRNSGVAFNRNCAALWFCSRAICRFDDQLRDGLRMRDHHDMRGALDDDRFVRFRAVRHEPVRLSRNVLVRGSEDEP